MVMKIKLFASAKKIAGGKDEVTLEFLERTFAINYKIAWESEANSPATSNTTSTLTPYDEIALFPPISGG